MNIRNYSAAIKFIPNEIPQDFLAYLWYKYDLRQKPTFVDVFESDVFDPEGYLDLEGLLSLDRTILYLNHSMYEVLYPGFWKHVLEPEIELLAIWIAMVSGKINSRSWVDGMICNATNPLYMKALLFLHGYLQNTPMYMLVSLEKYPQPMYSQELLTDLGKIFTEIKELCD